MRHQLTRSQWVPTPLEEVVGFFEDPRNLEQITPPFLGFRILTEGEIEMRVGALIDYSIRLHGVPLLWQTRIDEYVPMERFVDFQVKGPYRYWNHLHTFSREDGGTRIEDCVDYELPLGPLGTVAHALFVKRQLKTIFDYRYRVIEKRFGLDERGTSQAS